MAHYGSTCLRWVSPPLQLITPVLMSKTALSTPHRIKNPGWKKDGKQRVAKTRQGAKRKRRLKSKVSVEALRGGRGGGGGHNSLSTLYNIGEHFLPSEGQWCLTERVSFIHVYKSGMNKRTSMNLILFVVIT